jgi:adenine phosphoribosyltransferase
MDITQYIRTVPDFPKSGVQFRDITTLLRDPGAFRAVIEALASAYTDQTVDKVAAIESRGFIFGAALAHALHAGFVPIRKRGKLPAECFAADYELEYGTDRLELHRDGVQAGERVVLIDDLVATGGTAEAALALLSTAGAAIIGCAFVIELTDLGGRARLERRGHPVLALCKFTEA